jgi:hypothetical protein
MAEDASSSDSDVDLDVIIRTVFVAILNIGWKENRTTPDVQLNT